MTEQRRPVISNEELSAAIRRAENKARGVFTEQLKRDLWMRFPEHRVTELDVAKKYNRRLRVRVLRGWVGFWSWLIPAWPRRVAQAREDRSAFAKHMWKRWL